MIDPSVGYYKDSTLATSFVPLSCQRLNPRDHWYQPGWIDEEKATVARNETVKNQVMEARKFVSSYPAKLALAGGSTRAPSSRTLLFRFDN